jgi:WD40 repeat protein
LRIWDTTTGKELAHVPLHRDRVQTAAFSADGQVVTSVGDDRRIVRYDLASQEVTLDRELKGTKLRSLCLINDYLIAAAGADNTIHIFDVLADVELGKLTGHTGSVAVMCSSGDRLVSGSYDTTVRLWTIESALQPVRGITKPVNVAPLEVDKNMEIR